MSDYDFIIVGAGAGGCAIAARLSEISNVSVLVLEAGGETKNNDIVNVPGKYWKFFDNPDLDWGFKTVKQPHAGNKEYGWSRGKGLGGTTGVNFGMHAQASWQDLNNWEQLGNPGWNWNALAPYFRKSETYHPPSKEDAQKFQTEWVDPAQRGVDGPVQLSFSERSGNFVSPLWPETARNLGYPTPSDPRNGPMVGGFSQLTCVDPKTVTRSHAASAYLEPNRQRSNLHIQTGALALKVKFAEANGKSKAVGVEFEANGQIQSVTALKEVIVCAGSVKSPQLLECSGVGNAKILNELGVPVVADVAGVGENLMDHPMVLPCFRAADGVMTADVFLRDPNMWKAIEDMYNNDKTGPLAGMSTAAAFIPLDTIAPSKSDQDTVLRHIDSNPAPSATLREVYALQRAQIASSRESAVQLIVTPVGVDITDTSSAKAWIFHKFDFNMISFSLNISHPFSRGNTHAISKDARESPRIDPQYLSHPADLAIAGHAILHAQKIASTEPLASNIASGPDGRKVTSPQMKWCENIEDAQELARKCLFTIWHPSGTCAMLPQEKGGVVDPGCRVYGVDGLRVCDASIFPLMPHGNITSLIYACAEKVADAIKADHGLKA